MAHLFVVRITDPPMSYLGELLRTTSSIPLIIRIRGSVGAYDLVSAYFFFFNSILLVLVLHTPIAALLHSLYGERSHRKV